MWYDRDCHKETVKEWFHVGSRFSVINVADEHELMDIAGWIKKNLKQYSITEVPFYTSSPAKKYYLLETLITGLGGRSKFYNYYNYYDYLYNDYLYNLDKKPDKCVINQGIGNQSTAEGNFNVEQANQNVIVNWSDNEQKPLPVLKDEHIDYFLDNFIRDMNNFNNSILFLIQFADTGFSLFTKEFKQWFSQTFCRKLLMLRNIDICILNRGDLDILLDVSNQENIGKNLKIDDITKGAEPYIEHPEVFAQTLASSDGGTSDEVPYTKVCRAFSAYCKRQEIGV